MSRMLFSLAALVFFSASTRAFAQKDERNGFILGAGVGISWLSWSQSIEGVFPEAIRYNEFVFPLNTDFRFGVGFNKNKTMLYYWNKLNWLFVEDVEGTSLSWNAVNGMGLSYFFKSKAPSMYVNGGLGFSSWSVSPILFTTERAQGVGVIGGIGYEIMRHQNLEVTLMLTFPRQKLSDVTISTTTFVISLCYVGIAY